MSRSRVLILAILGVGLALIGGLFVGSIFRRSFTSVPTPTPPPPLTEQVVVTTHDIALGSVLSEGDLKSMEVPLGIAPSGTLKEVSAAIGRMTRADLAGGQMVMDQHLADPTNVNRDLAFVLEDTQVLMAFPADDLMSSLDILKRGDLVDILVSIEQEVQPAQANPLLAQETPQPETMLFTFDAIQRIEISAVVVQIVQQQARAGGGQAIAVPGQEATPQPTPTPSMDEVETVAILLALDPQDALVLKHLKDAGGTFDIVLRAPTSQQLFEVVPVFDQYLIDRYELEVEK